MANGMAENETLEPSDWVRQSAWVACMPVTAGAPSRRRSHGLPRAAPTAPPAATPLPPPPLDAAAAAATLAFQRCSIAARRWIISVKLGRSRGLPCQQSCGGSARRQPDSRLGCMEVWVQSLCGSMQPNRWAQHPCHGQPIAIHHNRRHGPLIFPLPSPTLAHLHERRPRWVAPLWQARP